MSRVPELLRRQLGRARRRLGRLRPPTAPPVCESVKEWSERRAGIEGQVVLAAERIERPLPRTIEPEILEAYRIRQTASLCEKYLVAIPRARIAGRHGLVILPDGSYAAESVYTRALLEEDADYRNPPGRPVVAKRGRYFSLLVIWARSGGYYHWLHDSVERLYRVLDTLPPDVHFVVPADLKPWQAETLGALGIREEQFAYFDATEIWELETLHFTTPTTNSGSSRREVEEWLRDTILGAYAIELGAGHRRIFISRRGIPKRRLTNEDAVETLLQTYGFETYAPERLSFREQVALFSEAAVVVAGHGSALANILFAPPGLAVVDLIESSMMPWAYVFWTLCGALDHEYWYCVAESVPRPGSQPDAFVPLDRLEATLHGMGLQPRV